jgi:hypothetical protein
VGFFFVAYHGALENGNKKDSEFFFCLVSLAEAKRNTFPSSTDYTKFESIVKILRFHEPSLLTLLSATAPVSEKFGFGFRSTREQEYTHIFKRMQSPHNEDERDEKKFW